MHDCTIYHLAMKTYVFSHCASLHHPSFDEMIFALVIMHSCMYIHALIHVSGVVQL